MRTFTMMMVLCLCAATTASAQRAFHAEELEHALHGLERGIEALAMLEKPELHAELERLADQVRRALDQAHHGADRAPRELQPISREVAMARVRALKAAIDAVREANRHEAAERIELAILLYAHAMEGHEAEVRELSHRAPSQEEQVDLLRMATRLYREFGRADRAEQLEGAIRELWQRDRHAERDAAHREHEEVERIVERRVERRGDAEVEREVVREERPQVDRDRAMGQRHLEIMRTAMHAFREAERPDAIRAMEHVIHARELEMAGHDGPDARHIRETAPKLGGQVELLTLAATIWDEFGHESKAGQLRELAQHFRQQLERRERRERERGQAVVEERIVERERRDMSPERERQLLERIERLEATMRDVIGVLRDMRERAGDHD